MDYYKIELSLNDVKLLKRGLASIIDADDMTPEELRGAVTLYRMLYDTQWREKK